MSSLLRKSTLAVAFLAVTAPAAASFTADFLFSNPAADEQLLNVTNTDGAGTSLDFFRIFLDVGGYGSYSNLSWINDQSSEGWTSNVIEFDPNFATLPAEFNNFRLPGIADGVTQTFRYNFDYAGALLPQGQTFSYQAYFGICDSSNPSSQCNTTLPELVPGTGIYYAGMNTGTLSYRCVAPDPNCSEPNPAPEPMTLALLGIGLAGVALGPRRRKN